MKLVFLLFLLFLVEIRAAFVHPGVGFSKAHLDDFKANVGNEPWKSGLDYLKNSYYASLGYSPQGPKDVVSRTPDINLYPYRRDSQAIYELALYGYIADSPAHLNKSFILANAWAVNHKSFAGAEIYLEIADYVPYAIGGFEILRAYYKNSTFEQVLKDYVASVYVLSSNGITLAEANNGSANLRGCNQGASQISQALYTAVLLDDATRFNQTLDAFLTHAGAGLGNSLPNGQIGDTGRDVGHAKGQLLHIVRIAEIFWTQGVDVYSLLDNRILRIVEYWLDFFYLQKEREFIHFGCQYGVYSSIGGLATSMDATPAYVAYSAYHLRKNVVSASVNEALPNMTKFQNALAIVYYHSADNSTARKPTKYWHETETNKQFVPGDKLIATNVRTGGGNYTYSNGVWTVRGSGLGPGKSFYFAGFAVDNDFTIKARVVSVTDKDGNNVTGSYAGGLQIRSFVGYNSAFLSGEIHTDGAFYDTRGGSTFHNTKWTYPAPLPPYWVKVGRRGPFLFGQYSPDGKNWTLFTKSNFGITSSTLYTGLTVLSGSDAAWATAIFDNVLFGNGTDDNFAAIPLEPYSSPSSGSSINGTEGTDGTDGANGSNGSNGTNGANGANGTTNAKDNNDSESVACLSYGYTLFFLATFAVVFF